MAVVKRIAPCLWFDSQAEQAVEFYTGIFPNSQVVVGARYGTAGHDVHHRPAGSVSTNSFELDGQPFTALNGGPYFTFNEAISLEVDCENQQEIDYYWDKLGAGGDPKAQQCGWLKDKFGVSWQVAPRRLAALVGDPSSEKSQRAMTAMLRMKKIDIAELERVYAG